MSPLHISKHTACFGVLAIVLLSALPARADEIIWDNGAPNLTGMWQSTDCEI